LKIQVEVPQKVDAKDGKALLGSKRGEGSGDGRGKGKVRVGKTGRIK